MMQAGPCVNPIRNFSVLMSPCDSSNWCHLWTSWFMASVWARDEPWWGWRARRRPGRRPQQSLVLWDKSPTGPEGWRCHNCSSPGPTVAVGCCTARSPPGGAACRANGNSKVAWPVRKGGTGGQLAEGRWGRVKAEIWRFWTVLHAPWWGGAHKHLGSGSGSKQRGSTCRV